jgi:hypothetical protein
VGGGAGSALCPWEIANDDLGLRRSPWELLVGRLDGPLSLRFLFQPAVAAVFAVRAGLKDFREARTPYLWSVFANGSDRHDLICDGWKDIGKVFVVAVILDVAYALIVHQWIFPAQALLIGVLLAIAPYVLMRGLTTHLRQLGVSALT